MVIVIVIYDILCMSVRVCDRGVIRMKKLTILVMLSISVLFTLSCKGAPAPPISSPVPNASNVTQGLRAGSLAPDFQLNDMTGKLVSLSDFRGKVVYLNFWAVW